LDLIRAPFITILLSLLDNNNIKKTFTTYLKKSYNLQNNIPSTDSEMKSYDTPDIIRFGEQIYFDRNKSVNLKKIKSHELFNIFKKMERSYGIKI
jgi:hypothetical protein